MIWGDIMGEEEAECMKLDDLLQEYFEFREIIKEKTSEKIRIAEKTQETEVQIQDFEKTLYGTKNSCKENEECLKVLKEQTEKNESKYLFTKKTVLNLTDYNARLSIQQTEHQEVIETLKMMIKSKENTHKLLFEELKLKEKRKIDLSLNKASLSCAQTLSFYNQKLENMKTEKKVMQAELMKKTKELKVLSEQVSTDKERYELEHIEVCDSITNLETETKKLRLRQNLIGSRL